MKPWKTSAATNETRNARPSFRLDSQWSGYGPILPQGTSRKPETGPAFRGLAICSLPDFPEFAQAVRYGVPGTRRDLVKVRLALRRVVRTLLDAAALTLPTKVPSDSLGGIGTLQRTSDKSLFPMTLGS